MTTKPASNPFLAMITTGIWLMEAEALRLLADKLGNAELVAAAISARNGGMKGEEAPLYTMDGDIARIDVSGVMMNEVPWIYQYFGIDATSYLGIIAAIEDANDNPMVSSIQLDVDSPGGNSDGIHAASDAIFNSQKPVTAHVDTLSASAAYWLTCQADTITATRGSDIGSIGAYTARYDVSRAYENEGYKVHLISSGGVKGAGYPGTAVTAEQIADAQRGIDELVQEFVADIARGRGKTPPDISQLADGRVWSASESITRGLIDRISADPIKESKAAMAKSLEQARDLVKAHPKHAGMIMDMATADADEKTIKAAIADADHVAALAEEKASYLSKITALEKTVQDQARELTDTKAKLADVDKKYAALSALADGAKEAAKVRNDPEGGASKTMTDAAFTALPAREQAKFIKSGGTVK